jgi:ankyrin repeat protein
VIGGFFKREYNNHNFLQELFHKNPKLDWLEEGLKTEAIDINHKDEFGNTFLMLCLKKSHFKSALWLINKHADVTLKNNEKKTPINIAIEKNNIDIVNELLDLNKLDINQRDIHGRSLLQNIVVFGNIEMAKNLIIHGADINNKDHAGRNILYDALSYGDQVFIQYLLALESIDLDFIDQDGNTIMQHPEVLKNDAIAKDLIVAGIDPTVIGKEKGNSYFLETILRGKEANDIIDLALEYGANVNARTDKGNTILTETINIASKFYYDKLDKKENLIQLVNKMLEHNGDINAIDKEGESALFNAIRMDDFEISSFLLDNDIDPNIQNNDGETILSELVLNGVKSISLIQLLLVYESSPTLKNKKNQTLYEILNNIVLHNMGTLIIQDAQLISKINKDGDYISIIRELLEYNDQNLDYLDSMGEPLFFKPLLHGSVMLFKLYIEYEVDIHQKNKVGHNIFFEYLFKVFSDNISTIKANNRFERTIKFLLSNNIDQNSKDPLGFTILHKIINTKCNEKLFDILTKTILFDYTIVDNLGRSVIHNAVWNNKEFIIKRVYSIDKTILLMEDNYGILPITYAALLGNDKLVLLFLELGSHAKCPKIAPTAIKKFTPMLKNLSKLKDNIIDTVILQKIDEVINQIERDFNVI